MEKSIIVFDAECNLCNGVVGRLLRFAPQEQFSLVPFQSPYGQELLLQQGFSTEQLDTVILFDDHGRHLYSEGFLRILSQIPRWRWLADTLVLIPIKLRDGAYKIAAEHRVRWFGKSQTCTLSY